MTPLRLVVCAFLLALTGCAGSGLTDWVPYHPAIPPLLAIVRDAGPEWSAHADALEGLYAAGRLYVVAYIPGGYDAYATWRVHDMIRVTRSFLFSEALRPEDKAALLVVEVCHVVTGKGSGCHEAEAEFLAALER